MYVFTLGRVYELDGLKPGPIDHGSCGEDWVDVIRTILQKRIDRYITTHHVKKVGHSVW